MQLGKKNSRPMKRLWRTMTGRQRGRQRRRLIVQARKHETELRIKRSVALLGLTNKGVKDQ